MKEVFANYLQKFKKKHPVIAKTLHSLILPILLLFESFYFLKLLILHILFEAWELFVQTSQPYNLTGDGNLVDTIIDTILFMLGAYIVYRCYH